MLAAALSLVSFIYFFLPPTHSFQPDQGSEAAIAGVIFVVAAIVLAGLVDRLGVARRSAEQSAAALAASEHEVQARARQQEAVAELGRLALSGATVQDLLDAAVVAIADSLGVRCAEVLSLDLGANELLVRAGAGWNDGTVGRARVGADARTLHGAALGASDPVVFAELAAAPIEVPDHLRRHGVVASVAVSIPGPLGPYGVIAAHSAEPRSFAAGEASVLKTAASVLGAAIQRSAAEDALRETRDELGALIEASPLPIVRYDADGIVTLWNSAATAVFGWTAEEAVGRLVPFVPEDKLDEFRVNRERVLAGRSQVSYEATRRTKGGEPIEVSFSNAPVRDAHGDVRGVVAILSDITEQKRRADDLAFLNETSETLFSILDYERTLAEIAGLAVPRLADCCVVGVVDQDEGGRHHVAVAHVDRAKEALVADLEERYPSDPSSPSSFIGRVLDEGRPRLVSVVTDELLREIACDDEHLAALRRLGLSSLVCVPLVGSGRTAGAITLLSGQSGRRFDARDLALARDLARHAALAVENARLYRQRNRIATTLQRSLLPPNLARIPGVEVAARYRAAGEGLDVGGDFYDVFEATDSCWAVVIGDVCGKGPEAAAVTGLSRHTIRASAIREPSPSRTLETLNHAILNEHGQTTFCTVVYGRVEPLGPGVRLTFACGGHPRPLLVPARGVVEPLGRHGTLVGAFPDPDFVDETVELAHGDVVVFYTDGLVEQRGRQADEGTRQLVDVLRASPGISAEDIAERIEHWSRSGDQHRDDVALLVLRVSPLA